MKILMFTWEFPPLISGGLGMACYGMIKALLAQGIKIDLVLPTKEFVYFPMRQVEDVDTLPVVFVDAEKQKSYVYNTFNTVEERLEFIGISQQPESYFQLADIRRDSIALKKEYWLSETVNMEERELWQEMTANLIGEEDLIRKVQEYTLRAEKLAKSLEYDLIHAHDWLCYPAGMLARKIGGKPLIVHIHATEFDRAGGPGDERIHKIEHAGMTVADKVIAVSQYTAQMIMSRYRIDTAKIKIVHNAFSVPDDAVIAKQRIFKGPVILFLGRITLQKGPDYFLEMSQRVLATHPEARFIMAGTGDMSRKLLRRSASLKLRNRFLFTGFLNRKQVERILQAADIYVLPSVSEPFGISPLEAMAFGITSIISKQSGVAEVVHHAFKIDFWDTDLWVETINHLIENPQNCVKMGIDGMHEVNRIQWDEAAEKIRQLYSVTLAEYIRKVGA
ncbi:MAG: glycosyltransferase family 4 protein [Candidatus Cloacimonetes bacterium]|jgi:glycosyltransferase involved in cell wall biosynthesis|nr:glycosyltransferase family 4 protein [Candidatus Cloacimonadota bacterium]MDY0336284.1 glycosyltransferase family 4 protein [Candidatus Cloacimonadaceae bacterium]MCK9334426.1 glycosyltransferase family 4 protein [Candidatus Cloacimonadota bacterium]MDD2542831.1 glycosyltransferase family 4 protein [Candidatus Cloacimonadota bacterium]MDD2683387.1 glycosyltransferase family 4 protein [Candidatus Cloacimonadota bacterium]